MQFRRVQCTKVLFCLTTFVLIVAYVQKLIFYVYHKFEAVQPPWPPSQLPRMVDVNFLQQQNDLIYEPKILCWISTYPRNRLKSEAVRATWGKDCDHFLIMSSSRDEDDGKSFCPQEFPFSTNFGRVCCNHGPEGKDPFYYEFCRQDQSIQCRAFMEDQKARCGNHQGVENPEYVFLSSVDSNYESLWLKTMEANLYISALPKVYFDFVVKADDDTFIDVGKLRNLLKKLSPQDPIYLGYALRLEDDNQNRSRTWMSGGAGYVLSWRAFQDMIAILKTSAEQNENMLALKAIAEDAMVGWLMSNRVNASFVHLKVGRMPALLPIPLHSLQMGLSNPWFRQLSRWDTSWKNLVSQKNTSFVISQHYIKPEEMFILYYQQN